MIESKDLIQNLTPDEFREVLKLEVTEVIMAKAELNSPAVTILRWVGEDAKSLTNQTITSR